MPRKNNSVADNIAAELGNYGSLALALESLDTFGHTFGEAYLPDYGENAATYTFETVANGDVQYARVTARNGSAVSRGWKTAIVNVIGPITPFPIPRWLEEFGIRVAALPKIVNSVRAAGADPEVNRIVLLIHSPGGVVFGVQEAFDAIRAVAKGKRVVAHINFLGASAAYWLATAATEIVATPSALVGNIGVRTRHVSLARAYEKEGIEITDIGLPASKIELSEARELSADARAEVERRVSADYELFKSAVSTTRPLDFQKSANQYGRIQPAADALGLGLIDRVSTFDALLSETPVVDLATPTRQAQLALATFKRK